MNNVYDFVVIGAGISGCTFASCLNKRFSDASILLIEHGRKVGGRSTTRNSRKNTIFKFDHGLASISLSKNFSEDINKLIYPLIKSKKLINITKDILLINEIGEIHNLSTDKEIFRGYPFMINFCEGIIDQSFNRKNIHFLFQTLVKSFKRENDLWRILLNEEKVIRSKNLVLSSSLIAHPRCLKIFNVNSLPLRDAFIPGNDEMIDYLIEKASKIEYIKRKNYILYVSNPNKVKIFNQRYLQVFFSKSIRDNLNFEKLIFQKQIDDSMIIILHCSYHRTLLEMSHEKIIKYLIEIFDGKQKFIDLFIETKLIDKMDWRASQPINSLIPKELQWSSKSKIGFCGDWFDLGNCKGVELALKSSIRLAKLL
ncbi:NAD(P)-binding protein [Prochlorococcus marinus]|uniref:NAD/FAD-dependent oxidoreductase n=1 Tax=Prochlorococcus marinus XMU1408 TaxID=2213228 RepID=A0A318R7K9_PROMR|nr:NAD(P)-binding protein [Prochlorococcus marinus]MBW3041096.1 hypothetical protein [Prochlorococcus marinus str. XMU1408]PYE03700.1 hypothetical protein DNJ73_00485 [Prochlorococcus marinus XMU1408]